MYGTPVEAAWIRGNILIVCLYFCTAATEVLFFQSMYFFYFTQQYWCFIVGEGGAFFLFTGKKSSKFYCIVRIDWQRKGCVGVPRYCGRGRHHQTTTAITVTIINQWCIVVSWCWYLLFRHYNLVLKRTKLQNLLRTHSRNHLERKWNWHSFSFVLYVK